MHFVVLVFAMLFVASAMAQDGQPGPGRYFVAVNGNDAWSGRLPAPNAAKTDGPFATLGRARDALRAEKGQKVVYVRGGTYYLNEPLALTPADSGASFLAYPGERPVLSGGRPVTGWRKGEGSVWTAQVPDAAKLAFRQLRVGGERQICARYPNFDPANPYKGGWSFVVSTQPRVGVFGASVVKIHTPGDWIEWKVSVPADGAYKLWLYYGAKNEPFGRTDMADRTTFRVDGQEPVFLQNLPDTGAWDKFQWSPTAMLQLTKGEHTLRWTNVKGGGLNFDAFALCDDPDWKPQGIERGQKPVFFEKTGFSDGKHLIVVQAEAWSAAQGKEMARSELKSLAHKTRFQFRPGDIRQYPRSPQPEIHIFPAWGWVNTILHVTRID
ncbi:MAG: carbohydrate-binding protein, partial [Planctomycetes bacterium]|nr:carbohydrate-binding protein [Planctomycetota bacterium]